MSKVLEPPDPRRRQPQRRLRGQRDREPRGVPLPRRPGPHPGLQHQAVHHRGGAGPLRQLDGRLATTVRGEGNLEADGTWRGSLYLVGGGDPSFGSRSFGSRNYGGGGAVEDLAAALESAGIRRVSGRIIGDETAFDTRRGGPSSGYRTSGYVGPAQRRWPSTAAWPPRAAAATSPGRRCSPPRGWTPPWAAAASTWRSRPAPATRPAGTTELAAEQSPGDVPPGHAHQPPVGQLLRRDAAQGHRPAGRRPRHHRRRRPRGDRCSPATWARGRGSPTARASAAATAPRRAAWSGC